MSNARSPAALSSLAASARAADAGAGSRVHPRARGGVLGDFLSGAPGIAALGVAFRGGPGEVLKVVDLVAGAGQCAARTSRASTSRRCRARPALEALRTGRVALFAELPRPTARRRLSLRRHQPRGPHGAHARRPRGPARRRPQSIRCRPAIDLVREPGIALHRLPRARPGRPRHHEQRASGASASRSSMRAGAS